MNDCKANEQKIIALEKRVRKLEDQRETDKDQVHKLDTSLQVFINEMKNISNELKGLVDNFKETIIKTENAHEEDIKSLKEELTKTNQKVDNLSIKLHEETTGADAKKYRDIAKYVITAIIGAVISFIFTYLNLK